MSRVDVKNTLEANNPIIHKTIDLTGPAQSEQAEKGGRGSEGNEPAAKTIQMSRITPTLEHVRSSALGSAQASPTSSHKPAKITGAATKIVDYVVDPE